VTRATFYFNKKLIEGTSN